MGIRPSLNLVKALIILGLTFMNEWRPEIIEIECVPRLSRPDSPFWERGWSLLEMQAGATFKTNRHTLNPQPYSKR